MNKIDRLRQIVAESLNVPPERLTEESGLGLTPGWDSMAHVSILVSIEQEFGIQVDETLMNCRTIAELVEHLFGKQTE